MIDIIIGLFINIYNILRKICMEIFKCSDYNFIISLLREHNIYRQSEEHDLL